jgi:hypothetical protein
MVVVQPRGTVVAQLLLPPPSLLQPLPLRNLRILRLGLLLRPMLRMLRLILILNLSLTAEATRDVTSAPIHHCFIAEFDLRCVIATEILPFSLASSKKDDVIFD